jgi:Zn ribbon nucleic-acid-binding protein
MKEIPGTRKQHRRDFTADYECEACKSTEKISGYDDYNFHVNVVPTFKCKKCGESTNSLKLKAVDNTVVPAGVVI